MVAVTGAEMPIKLDGERAATAGPSFKVKAGQVLSFDFLKAGARIYIAVSGGIDVPVALGSRSTYAIGALGGFKGRAARGGRRTAGRAPAPARREGTLGARGAAPPAGYAGRAARAAGPLLAPPHRGSGRRLLRRRRGRWRRKPTAWAIASAAAGRSISCRAQQPFGAGSDPSNIVDSCYPYGSIQVPGGTEPIILHRDAVSGGGYFMIGTVICADMDLIGQMQPHTPTRFVKVDMEQALQGPRRAGAR